MNIGLFCAAGMSTSILVERMKEAAQKKGKDATIAAYSISELEQRVGDIDVALLGPQVGFQLEKAKEICASHNVPVEVIAMADYGTANGMAVLKQAYMMKKQGEDDEG